MRRRRTIPHIAALGAAPSILRVVAFAILAFLASSCFSLNVVSNLRDGDETSSVESALRNADGGLDIDLAHVMTVWGKQTVTLKLGRAELDQVLATPVDERTRPSDLTRLVLPRGRLIERDEEEGKSDGDDADSLPVDERTPARWLDPLSAPSSGLRVTYCRDHPDAARGVSSLALLVESAEHTPARAGVIEFERHSHGPWRIVGWLTLGLALDVAIILAIGAL